MAISPPDRTSTRIHETGLIAVIRGARSDTVRQIVEALLDGGCEVIELTADTPDAIDLIDEMDSFVGNDASVGIGTVLDAETTRAAQRAGADFVVTPSVEQDVIETANRHGTLVIAGAFTPTEAIRGYEAGADLVKIFPASTGGPGHIAALNGPIGHIPFVPTGGVTLDNVADFISSGADAVGVGGGLIDRDEINAGNFDAIRERASTFRDTIDQATRLY